MGALQQTQIWSQDGAKIGSSVVQFVQEKI